MEATHWKGCLEKKYVNYKYNIKQILRKYILSSKKEFLNSE